MENSNRELGLSRTFNSLTKTFLMTESWRPLSLKKKASEKLLDKISSEQWKARDAKVFR
jgi:hypothetical protein